MLEWFLCSVKYSQIVNHFARWELKFRTEYLNKQANRQRTRRKYWFNIEDYKKGQNISCQSPFNKEHVDAIRLCLNVEYFNISEWKATAGRKILRNLFHTYQWKDGQSKVSRRTQKSIINPFAFRAGSAEIALIFKIPVEVICYP
jgi:hypothetical protein